MNSKATLYAAEHCKTPLFNWSDKKWHVDYIEDEKWVFKAFNTSPEAHDFYLKVFHTLEIEYESKEDGKNR